MNNDIFSESIKTYEGISRLLKESSYDEILTEAARTLDCYPETLERHPMGGYSKGRTSGAYRFVLFDLITNISRYDKVYSLLDDEISKSVFTALMQYRVVPDIKYIQSAFDGEHHQYFDKSFVECDENEVFVDCGGFTGDTAEDFISQYEHYKRIYVYEPSDDNIEKCRGNLSKYHDVVVRNCGVGEKYQMLPISNSSSSSSFVGVNGGDKYIEIINLDEDIPEPVTFIKMDIEGFEIPSLIGAKNHIRNESPKLAICTYHIVSDMWEIPLLINSINPNYRFFFRHYRPDQNWESVVYAIPKQKQVKTSCEGETVSFMGECSDVAREYEAALKALRPDETAEEYIKEKSSDIKCIMLRGINGENAAAAKLYKSMNPCGKVLVFLETSIRDADSIIQNDGNFTLLMQNSDLTLVTDRELQKHLNEKWQYKINCVEANSSVLGEMLFGGEM